MLIIVVFGILVFMLLIVFLFFVYQVIYKSRSKDSLKSDEIIRAFEPDNLAPKLSDMIMYHKTHEITKYEIRGDLNNE